MVCLSRTSGHEAELVGTFLPTTSAMPAKTQALHRPDQQRPSHRDMMLGRQQNHRHIQEKGNNTMYADVLQLRLDWADASCDAGSNVGATRASAPNRQSALLQFVITGWTNDKARAGAQPAPAITCLNDSSQ